MEALPANRKISRGIAWNGAAQAIIGIAEIVSTVVTLSFWVSAEEWGIAGAAILLYPILDALADSGLSNAVIQSEEHSNEALSTVFWIGLLISLVLFTGACVLGPLYAQNVGHPVVAWLVIAYGAKLVVQNAYQMPLALLRKEMRFEEVARMRVLAHLSESISRPVFAALGATIWCSTLAALMRIAVISVHAQIVHPYRPSLVFRPRLVGSKVQFAIRNLGSQVLYYSYANVDYYIVRTFFGDAALGIYRLAFTLVLEPVKAIANITTDVALPAFSRLRRDAQQVAQQVRRFVRFNLIAVCPLLVILFCCAEDVLLLTANKWSPAEVHLAAVAIKILCGAAFFRAMGFLGPPLLDGLGHPGLTLRYMMVSAVSLVGTFLVVATQLARGAVSDLLLIAWAWLLAYPIALGLLGYYAKRLVPVLSWRELWLENWRVGASSLLAIAAAWLVRWLLADANLAVRAAGTLSVTLAVLVLTFGVWQKITPRTIRASIQ